MINITTERNEREIAIALELMKKTGKDFKDCFRVAGELNTGYEAYETEDGFETIPGDTFRDDEYGLMSGR